MYMSMTVEMLARGLTYLKTHQNVPFSSVQFPVGQYLNQVPLKKKKVISRPG